MLQLSETVEPTVKPLACANGFSHTPFGVTGGAEHFCTVEGPLGAHEAVVVPNTPFVHST